MKKLIKLNTWIKLEKPKSSKNNSFLVEYNCKKCDKIIHRLPSVLTKKNLDRLFCSLGCSTSYRNIHDGTPSQKVGWREKWINKSIQNGTLPVGKKNARYGVKLSIETKQKISKNKSEPTKSHVKFVDYIKKNGEIIRLQGHWEVEFARWLDKNNIEYLAHPKEKFSYTDSKGQTRHYSPDFWIPSWNCYVDPKNYFCFKQDIYKINKVREEHKINLLILTSPLLRALGCDIKGY